MRPCFKARTGQLCFSFACQTIALYILFLRQISSNFYLIMLYHLVTFGFVSKMHEASYLILFCCTDYL